MSITRRQFLLSTAGAAAGAIIPSFYHRALEFFENSTMVSCWRGVRVDDEVTLSLLQQRLNDLGTGLRIVTGYAV